VLEHEHEGAVILENIGSCLPVDTAQHPRRRWGVGGGGLIGRGPQIRSPRRWQLQRMSKRLKNFIPVHSIPKTDSKC